MLTRPIFLYAAMSCTSALKNLWIVCSIYYISGAVVLSMCTPDVYSAALMCCFSLVVRSFVRSIVVIPVTISIRPVVQKCFDEHFVDIVCIIWALLCSALFSFAASLFSVSIQTQLARFCAQRIIHFQFKLWLDANQHCTDRHTQIERAFLHVAIVRDLFYLSVVAKRDDAGCLNGKCTHQLVWMEKWNGDRARQTVRK